MTVGWLIIGIAVAGFYLRYLNKMTTLPLMLNALILGGVLISWPLLFLTVAVCWVFRVNQKGGEL